MLVGWFSVRSANCLLVFRCVEQQFEGDYAKNVGARSREEHSTRVTSSRYIQTYAYLANTVSGRM